VEFSDKQIDFMRFDLENDFAATKFINAAKRLLKRQGKNFDEEFKKWKARLIKKNKGQEVI